MANKLTQIKNYIRLHTSDMDNDEYADMMRELSLWASDQADIIDYGPEEQDPEE